MPDPSLLFWGILFSSAGLGFFIYGKKQNAVVPLVAGIALFYGHNHASVKADATFKELGQSLARPFRAQSAGPIYQSYRQDSRTVGQYLAETFAGALAPARELGSRHLLHR